MALRPVGTRDFTPEQLDAFNRGIPVRKATPFVKPDITPQNVAGAISRVAPSPVSGLFQSPQIEQNVEALKQREESVVAGTGQDILRGEKGILQPTDISGGPASLITNPIIRSLMSGRAKQAAQGEIAPEIGDVAREAGVPEPIAATAGVVGSALLPSNAPLTFMGGSEGTKLTKEAASKARFAKAFKGGLLKKAKLPPAERIGRTIKLTRSAGDKVIKQAKDVTKKAVDTAVTKFQTVSDDLTKGIKQSAGTASRRVQQEFPKFAKRVYDVYDKTQRKVAEQLSKSGKFVTRREAVNGINNSLDDLERLGIRDGRVMDELLALRQKYTTGGVPGKVPSGQTLADEINFIEYLDDMRNVRNIGNLDRAVLGAEDMAAATYSKKVGDVIAGKSKEFSKMQKSYSEFVKTRTDTHKIFKIKQGETSTKGGTKFIERTAKEKSKGLLESGEEKFIKNLEEGIPFFGKKGVGKVTKETQKKAADLTKAKTDINKGVKAIKKVGQDKVDKETKALVDKVAKLESKQFSAKESQALNESIAKKLKDKKLKNAQIRGGLFKIGGGLTILGLGQQVVRNLVSGGSSGSSKDKQ